MYVDLSVKISNAAENESADEAAEWVRDAIFEEYPGLTVEVKVLGYAESIEAPA